MTLSEVEELELLELENENALATQGMTGAPASMAAPSPWDVGLDVARRGVAIVSAPFAPRQALQVEREGAQAIGRVGAAAAETIQPLARQAAKNLPRAGSGGRAALAAGLAGKAAQFLAPKGEAEAQAQLLAGPAGEVASTVVRGVGRTLAPRLSAAGASLLELAEKYGIQLSPADINKSEALARLESFLEKTPLGGERIAKFRQAAWGKVRELAEGISERLGTSASKAEVGEIVSRTRRELAREAGDNSDQAYARFEAMLSPETEMGAQNTLRSLDDLLAREMKKSPRLRSQSLISELEWVKSRIRSGQDMGGGQIVPAARFGDMAEVRSRIGGLIGALGGGGGARSAGERFIATQEEAAYRRLFGAVARDQEAFANSGGAALSAAYAEARDLFKLAKGTFDNKVLRQVRRLGEEAPERIVSLIAKPNNVTAINRTKAALGPRGIEAVQKRFVQDLMEAAGTNSEGQAFANPAAFVRALKRFDEPTLKALLPEETVSALQGLSRLWQSIGTAEKMAGNPSGTGKAVISAGSAFLPAVLAALTPGGLEGRVLGATAGTGAVLLTPALMAEAYLSPFGRRLLIQGYRIPASSPLAAKWAGRMSTFLAGKAVPGRKPQ